jgi:hypothetical protein
MLIQRHADGFYVATHNWKGHCPHEDAVIRRVAQWFNRSVPDRLAGKMRDSVRNVSVEVLDNGYYVNVNHEAEHVPTTEMAWQRILALFGESESVAVEFPAITDLGPTKPNPERERVIRLRRPQITAHYIAGLRHISWQNPAGRDLKVLVHEEVRELHGSVPRAFTADILQRVQEKLQTRQGRSRKGA